MILTCPQCATRYQVDGTQFPAEGRKVRCAKCGHLWQQEPPQATATPAIDLPAPEPAIAAPAAAPPAEARAPVGPAEALGPERAAYVPPAVTAPVIADEPELPKAHRAENVALVAGWIGLAVIVVAAGWSAVHFRQAIASAWPQSASLYSAVGMKVNARGIDISDVVSRRSTQGGATVLSISGDLTNITNHDVTVPAL
ncbi:MAG TPA: zinc-ribbon domain-containing protein, partial [Rhizomicrobium sp.]